MQAGSGERDGAHLVADVRGAPEQLVMLRQEIARLQALARSLTADQRVALACQLAQVPNAAVCEHFGWSIEKYRKVAQRGRARLRQLMAAEEMDVPAGQRTQSDEKQDLPMTIPTPHRRVPRDPGRRVQARRRGRSRERTCGRGPEGPPVRSSAAGVERRGGCR